MQPGIEPKSPGPLANTEQHKKNTQHIIILRVDWRYTNQWKSNSLAWQVLRHMMHTKKRVGESWWCWLKGWTAASE